jgi:hypothetical protein
MISNRPKLKKHGIIFLKSRIDQIHTGGSGTEPVITVYCLKTSRGVGPIKKNPSKIPDSNIQCVVTSGTSFILVVGFVAKKFATVEKKF